MPAEKIDRIFGALASAGYPIPFQKRLLPEWVTTEVLADNAASTEIAAILAQRLGLRTSLLASASPQVETLRRRDTRYKRSIPARPRDLTVATSVAVAVAEMVALACKPLLRPFPVEPHQLRQEIFKAHGGKWIGLRNLLLSCWAHGIPVVRLDHFGPGIPKMDGMIVVARGRPVIILSKSTESCAWQLFILAHEVGHCALKHVSADEILIDQDLGEKSYALADADPDELAADRFAITLLNGREDATYTASNSSLSAADLAQAAMQFGREHSIDPGHIVLNYGNRNAAWPLAMKALKFLEGQTPPAGKVIGEALWRHILPELLPPDSLDFLQQMTGSNISAE